jgi:hypothetical protein
MNRQMQIIILLMLFSFAILGMTFSPINSVWAAPPQNQNSQGGTSLVSDLIGATSGISQFFGDAISWMGQAIGYLTGGVQAAENFQSGTDIINDMLVNGPPQPETPAETATTQEGSAQTPAAPIATTQSLDMDSAAFRTLLGNYNELGREEKQLLEKADASGVNNDAGIQEVLTDLRKTREANRNKILFALNHDIEEKKFEKLHLLIDYLNTEGEETVGFFLEIVEETRLKLQFTLVQAQNMGLKMDIEVIEGKLKLIFSFTSGAQEE